MVVTGIGKNNLLMSKISGRRITRCMQFATLTQIASLCSAASHTPKTSGDILLGGLYEG